MPKRACRWARLARGTLHGRQGGLSDGQQNGTTYGAMGHWAIGFGPAPHSNGQICGIRAVVQSTRQGWQPEGAQHAPEALWRREGTAGAG